VARDWQPIVNTPPVGLLVLVRGPHHAGVALACFDARGWWDVQPYGEERYAGMHRAERDGVEAGGRWVTGVIASWAMAAEKQNTFQSFLVYLVPF